MYYITNFRVPLEDDIRQNPDAKEKKFGKCAKRTQKNLWVIHQDVCCYVNPNIYRLKVVTNYEE